MPAKTTTQILEIRWRDRAWQPRIRRNGPVTGSPAGRGQVLPGTRGQSGPVTTDLRAPDSTCSTKAPAGFVRRMILALRPRRKRNSS